MSEIGMIDWSKINKNGLEGRTIRANKWNMDRPQLNRKDIEITDYMGL